MTFHCIYCKKQVLDRQPQMRAKLIDERAMIVRVVIYPICPACGTPGPVLTVEGDLEQ